MNIRIFHRIDDPFLKSEWERLEVEADVFLHLRQRVVHRIRVVLGRDTCQSFGFVTILLEVALGDLAENAGKAALHIPHAVEIQGGVL